MGDLENIMNGFSEDEYDASVDFHTFYGKCLLSPILPGVDNRLSITFLLQDGKNKPGDYQRGVLIDKERVIYFKRDSSIAPKETNKFAGFSEFSDGVVSDSVFIVDRPFDEGPAIIDEDGTACYYKNGYKRLYHEGPGEIQSDGSEIFYDARIDKDSSVSLFIIDPSTGTPKHRMYEEAFPVMDTKRIPKRIKAQFESRVMMGPGVKQ